MNLIPECSGWNMDYYCTWSAQGWWNQPRDQAADSVRMRNRMGEDFLFGEQGILHQIDPRVRGELVVVLDDGWDVPCDSGKDGDSSMFGSLMVDEERFPSCKGSPEERLIALSRKVRSMGYAGMGLWVAVQMAGDRGAALSDGQIYEYWAERARWCHAAGIRYWKNDWGRYGTDVRFRHIMTRAAQDHAPQLMIEHLYPIRDPMDSELPADDRLRAFLQIAKETFPYSDALRTYDVSMHFEHAITLNRVSLLARQGFDRPEGSRKGILNTEDAIYLAPGCGAACGAMRLQAPENEEPPDDSCVCLTELWRLLAWHRIAPPFCLHGVEYHEATERLVDVFDFPEDYVGWPDTHGQTVRQSAPARMSFGISLPGVQPDAAGEVPYAMASRHPQTGAVALCALARTFPGRCRYTPSALISLDDLDADCPIGLFGEMAGVRLCFRQNIQNRRVMAQDLAAGEAVDLTEAAVLEGNALYLPGEALKRLCRAHQPAHDRSAPAVVVRLI